MDTLSNTAGALFYGFAMIVFMIGLVGMFICYLIMPLRALWLLYRRFKPNQKFTINQKSFKLSLWFLGFSFAAIAAYRLAVFNVKYPDSFLMAIFHVIPLGLFLAFEQFQVKAHIVTQTQKVTI
jgi:hypothetical protein